MSSSTETTYYMELQPGDAVQDGDQWLDSFGQWQPYVCKDQISGVVFSGVKARRPIRATHQTTFEEVPGGRTLQQAVEQPQRERIAYEELRPGDIIQAGDEFRDADGRWHAYDALRCGSCVYGAWGGWARRPYKITAILEIGDALADAQQAATQLQDERDEARKALTQMLAQLTNQAEVLAEVRADEKRLFDDLELLRSEYIKLQAERDEARNERDLARAEVARLSTEIWARKPLEDRVAALTDEVAQLQAERREWIDRCNAESARAARLSEQLSAAEVAVKSAQRARDELQLQVDELRAGLIGVVSAEHVYSMLEDMLDQTEWVGQCLDSSTYEQMSCIQRTISVIAERVNGMGKEATSADA